MNVILVEPVFPANQREFARAAATVAPRANGRARLRWRGPLGPTYPRLRRTEVPILWRAWRGEVYLPAAGSGTCDARGALVFRP
jgi:hypothetical protein